MHIERYDNGNIEINFSFFILSYLALISALCCLIGIGYFWVYKDLNIFSMQIIGLVLAALVLSISGTIIYESSNFIFNKEKSELHWKKKKYFLTKRGIIPFHDIQEIKIDRADNNAKEMRIYILTPKKVISMSDSHTISTNYDIEELVGEVKSITGLSIDVSAKSRANILLELGQTKGALDIIREEMNMSLEEAKDYLGI